MKSPIGSAQTQWARLLHMIAAQNEEAMASFYDETSARVYGLALRIIGDPADAEEVTLDVYTQVWRSAASYNSEKGSPLAWLMMMTRSRALDRMRSRRTAFVETTEVENLISRDGDPESMVGSTQRVRFLNELMAELPFEQRVLIEKVFFHGMTQAQLANSLGLPLGTVKSRIRFGMNKLRMLVTGKLQVQGSAIDG